MPIEFRQELLVQMVRHLAAGQMIQPHPGERAHGHFQGAGPVDPAQERVLFYPVLPLAKGLVQKLAPVGEEESLREQWKMLVPVQFPDDFVIARAREIQVR